MAVAWEMMHGHQSEDGSMGMSERGEWQIWLWGGGRAQGQRVREANLVLDQGAGEGVAESPLPAVQSP